jgi:hypothetical protein
MTGRLLKTSFFDYNDNLSQLFNDNQYWEMGEDAKDGSSEVKL